MKAARPLTEFHLWRNERLFNIDFATYSLRDHSFPRHFHDYYVIELVVKGTDRFYCDGRNYTAQQDQWVFINPGEIHTGNAGPGDTLEYLSCCPSAESIRQIATALDISIPADFRFSRTLAKQPILAKLFREFIALFHTPGEQLRQEELFVEIMTGLLKGNDTGALKTQQHEDQRIKQLRDYLHTHCREDVSLEQMAATVNLNPFHLVRLFKKHTGVSPYHYLLVARTEYARQLLRKGYRVNEAAAGAGFYDTSHLHRLLRKFAATSPKSFLLSKGQDCTIFTA